jgi:hypothetical protein
LFTIWGVVFEKMFQGQSSMNFDSGEAKGLRFAGCDLLTCSVGGLG